MHPTWPKPKPGVHAGISSLDELLAVLEGSAIEIPLAPYTHFCLFNPFDNAVIARRNLPV